MVALKLHTGRTHQIRVHMLAIGHPLVCDSKYFKSRFPADCEWCPRNFLHTYHLGFLDVPVGNELRKRARLATVESQVGSSILQGGSQQNDSSSDHHQPVDVYCPLPEDLRASLAELSPVDKESGVHRAAWLSRDAASLCSFDQYAENHATNIPTNPAIEP